MMYERDNYTIDNESELCIVYIFKNIHEIDICIFTEQHISLYTISTVVKQVIMHVQ